MSDHVYRQVSQNLITNVLQVADLSQTGDEEESNFIVILVHHILYQILVEESEVCR